MFGAVVWLLLSGSFCQDGQSSQNNNPAARSSGSASWLTSKRFQQELDRPFSGSWANLEYRQLLKEVAADRQVAIVLDRRIDPSASRPIQVNNSPLRMGLTSIARQADADATVCDNVIYVGPKETCRTLRTLIELRVQDLNAKEARVSTLRRTELLKYQTFESLDLDSPIEILEKFSRQAKLKIENPQAVPHDLWAAMVLPEVSVVEAISIVLTQFDLTFQWKDEGRAIELVPPPREISVERKHPVKKKTAESLTLIRQTFPKLHVEQMKSEILVRGLTEDHEAVAALLRGESPSPVKIEAPQPLRKQIFLLKAEQVPVSAIIRNLEGSGVTFEYDPDELKQAGIDLENRVDIDVKKATAEEFFKLVFDPVKVQFEIDNLTVRLRPKK